MIENAFFDYYDKIKKLKNMCEHIYRIGGYDVNVLILSAEYDLITTRIIYFGQARNIPEKYCHEYAEMIDYKAIDETSKFTDNKLGCFVLLHKYK